MQRLNETAFLAFVSIVLPRKHGHCVRGRTKLQVQLYDEAQVPRVSAPSVGVCRVQVTSHVRHSTPTDPHHRRKRDISFALVTADGCILTLQIILRKIRLLLVCAVLHSLCP